VAGQGLEHVFERDDSFEPAIFAADEGDQRVDFERLFEGIGYGRELGRRGPRGRVCEFWFRDGILVG